jgi:alanine racemase
MISTSPVAQRLDPSATSPCWLEIDLDSIVSNVRAVRRLLDPGTAVAAVVKANAYGLGAAEVARAALAAGATVLAVARIQEGVALRRAGLRAPILNLAYTAPDEVETAVQFGITPTIADVEVVRALARAARGRPPVAVHLKVDTGLSRFGAQPRELPALLSALADEPALHLEGLSSHFATADEPDPAYAEEQLRRFQSIVGELEERGIRPRIRHMANSAATLALPAARFDLVRLGISLSGTSPLLSDTPPAGLQSAVALRARLARVYDLPAGASVGYGQSFICRRPTRAGLVPVGYADGLPRATLIKAPC